MTLHRGKQVGLAAPPSEVQMAVQGHNQGRPPNGKKAGFYGLNLSSLYTSLRAVLEYLDPRLRSQPDRRCGMTHWSECRATGRLVV